MNNGLNELNELNELDQFDFSGLSPVDAAAVQEYLRRRAARAKGKSFLQFAKALYPWFQVEAVHVLIARHFELLREGKIDRLLLNMPPRTGKSVLTSELLPAWWMGLYPSDKILHTSYALGLVEKFGRKIRNMLNDPVYQDIFPGTRLSKDSKAAAQWATTQGGEYNASGVGGGVAGKGFNLGLIDDPVSEQDMFSKNTMDAVDEWYGSGLYTRRQPDRNRLVLTMTRWRVDDQAGRLLDRASRDATADRWTHLKIPAVLTEESAAQLNEYADDPMVDSPHWYKPGDSFSPRRWPLLELERTRNQVSRKAWASLYNQSPTEEDGSILLRKYWEVWPKDTKPPLCEYIIQSYDTAFETEQRNDFSARTTWGMFKHEKTGRYCALLLEAMNKRLQFPELRQNAWDSYKAYTPDRVLIEKAASGHPLIHELRKRGVPITPIPPKGSKDSRMHAASIPLEQGMVYYFESRWANEVIDQCAAFPNAPHDDLCFPAGTKIALPGGRECDILDLREGDLVATPSGARRVEVCVCSDPCAELVEVTFSTGATLAGTASHPVYVPRLAAFVPLGSLSIGDKVCAPCSVSKLYATTELTTAGIQTVRTKAFPGISMGSAVARMTRCIGAYGKTRMAPSLRGMSYTIETVTRQITSCLISNVLPLKNTVSGTVFQLMRRLCISASGAESVAAATHLYRNRPLFANAAGRDFTHTRQTAPSSAPTLAVTHSIASGRPSGPVSYALRSSGLLLEPYRALQSAVRSTGVEKKWRDIKNGIRREIKKHMPAFALCAANPSTQNTRGHAYVPKSAALSEAEQPSVVGMRRLPERSAVYAVKVVDTHVFYANGILVHNCDSVANALIFLRRTFHLDSGNDRKFDKDVLDEDEARLSRKPLPVRSYAHRQTRMHIAPSRF